MRQLGDTPPAKTARRNNTNVGRIILTDDAGDLPATFADDSYADRLEASTVTVLAQFPDSPNLTWHFELLSQMKRREVKYSDFRKRRNDLPPDLVRRVLRGVRAAVIAISDDRQHRVEMEARLVNITRKPLDTLDPSVEKYFRSMISQYADDMVLLYSPLFAVGQFLGDSDDDFHKYKRVLENPRNIRVFACRAVGAFIEIVKPDNRLKAIKALEDMRYFADDHFEARLMLDAQIPTRVFDKGNEKVTSVIRKLRTRVHDRIEHTHYLVLPEGSGIVEEEDSHVANLVGASDIAAGFGRDLYESSDGLKKVCEAFDLVILNGQIVRH